jgi:uncharacterized protein (DUF58 family)
MIIPGTRAIALAGAGIGTLALVGAIVPQAAPWVVTAVFLMCAVAAADAWLGSRPVRRLRVLAPDLIRTARGRSEPLSITVENRTGPEGIALRAQHLEAALNMPGQIAVADEILEAVESLAPGEHVELRTAINASACGEYRIERCALRTRSPLGFWAHRSTVPLTTTVRVYPNLLADRTAAQFLKRRETGTRLTRYAGKGREFEKLREYLPGDAWDEVDWKATARRGKPVVRMFQVERTQEIYVALDTSRLSGRAAGEETMLDRYVSAALTLALAAEAQGDRFGLVSFSGQVQGFVRADRGKNHFRACREAVYKLRPAAVEPDYRELFSFLKTRLTRRALVLILGALDDPLTGEMFERYSAVVSGRHLLIACMAQPPGSVPLFETHASDERSMYDALSGHLQWRRLAELRKSCERQGVALHLLPPAGISGAMTGIYMDVKRRQRL